MAKENKMIEGSKTLIRWLSSIVIIFLILITIIYAHSKPYEISISMDENTKLAIKHLSEIRTTYPSLIEHPRAMAWIPSDNMTCYYDNEIETYNRNMEILYGGD